MIELITGLPGNAKTLYTIAHVKAWAERESRPVYYHGIPELTLDWQQIDPEKWMECPPGAIVVIDEAQKVYRNRSVGAQPPEHVKALETHRHLGIDLVFITQHPMLIDPSVRRLTQTHKHMVRIWGMQASTVHKWDAVRDNCDKPAARRDSEKTKWVFDKSVFKLYKSSELHTVKRSIPLRAKLLLLVPVLLFASGWYVYRTLVHKPAPAPVAAVAGPAAPAHEVPGQTVSADPSSKPFDPVADARQFVAMNTPRVEGLPQTAPKYDELTKPVRVPVPAACIQRGSATSGAEVSCKCFTQQGTPMDVKFNMCLEFARNGFFQDFDADRDREGVERMKQGQQVLSSRPDQSMRDRPQVLAFTDIPTPVKEEYRPQDKQVQDGPPVGRGKALPPVGG